MVDTTSEYFHFVPINHSKDPNPSYFHKAPSFVCQICQRSLKVHPSFHGIDISSFSECSDARNVIEKLDSDSYKQSDSYALTPPDASSTGVTGSSSSSDSSLKPSLKIMPEDVTDFVDIHDTSPNSYLLSKEMLVSNSINEKLSLHSVSNSMSVLTPNLAGGNDPWSMSVTRESMRKDDLIVPSSFSSQTWRSRLRTPKPSPKKNNYDDGNTGGMNTSLSYDPFFLSSLFQLLIESYGVDLPLCSNCSRNVQGSLQDMIDYLDYDIDSYDEFLTQLNHPYFDKDHFSEAIEDLDEKKSKMSSNLDDLRMKIKDLEHQTELLNKEEEEIQISMKAYWEIKNETEMKQRMIHDKMLTAQNNSKLKTRLEMLRISNVVNDSFYIDVDGHYSKINNIDLCRLKIYRVETNKINSGLGFVSNLFIVMAKHLKCIFKEYIPQVSGSSIKLLRINDQTMIQIDKENEGFMAKLGFQKSTAMMAFLTCVDEIINEIKKEDGEFEVPHKIMKEECTIGDISLKKGVNSQEDHFTKGLKYLLSNLKVILLWLLEKKGM